MNEFVKNLPKKRMGAGVIFFDEQNRILIVKPSYKNHWSMPGGVVEENESPRQACIREVKEEINLDVSKLNFLCVDHISSDEEKSESLQFIFFGGVLKRGDLDKLKVDGKEIVEFKFVSEQEAGEFLHGGHFKSKLSKCIDAIKSGTSLYLENGEF